MDDDTHQADTAPGPSRRRSRVATLDPWAAAPVAIDGQATGSMFWFTRKKLLGSYLRFTATSRS